MRTCSRCSSSVALADAQFCPSCGAPIAVGLPSAARGPSILHYRISRAWLECGCMLLLLGVVTDIVYGSGWHHPTPAVYEFGGILLLFLWITVVRPRSTPTPPHVPS